MNGVEDVIVEVPVDVEVVVTVEKSVSVLVNDVV